MMWFQCLHYSKKIHAAFTAPTLCPKNDTTLSHLTSASCVEVW